MQPLAETKFTFALERKKIHLAYEYRSELFRLWNSEH